MAHRQLYAGTQLLLQSACPRFGIDVTFVDGTEPGAFAAAVRPGKTTLVWAETPANPRLDLVDLAELGAIRGPMTVVDSTFATPLLQQPLAYGVDLVMHSATKAIAGHNDATLGVVAGSAELLGWLWSFAVLQGASPSPFDALNALRGLRTLPVRLRQQTETAGRLADLPRAPTPAPRRSATRACPAIRSTSWRTGRCRGSAGCSPSTWWAASKPGRRFVESVQVAQMAPSLGGPETLVTHPASTTHVNLTPDELAANGIGEGTIRVSVGLEHPDDLVADFAQALEHPATAGR